MNSVIRKNGNYIEAVNRAGGVVAAVNANMPAKRPSGAPTGRTYGEEYAAGNLCTCAFPDDGELLIRAN